MIYIRAEKVGEQTIQGNTWVICSIKGKDNIWVPKSEILESISPEEPEKDNGKKE